MRASTHQPSFRVFLSSPGDVKAEREAAERVVRRIGGIYAAHVDIVLERWEGKFYQATAGFQEQIEATSAFDLVVGILWKRIGTELPPDLFRRPDGTAFESGTVLELESALEASAAPGGKPSIFVFRKNAEILFSKVNFADEKAQNDLLDIWWNRTFRDAEGRFRRASEGFMTTQEFETRFENLLVDQLRGKRLIPDSAVWDIEDKGSPYPGLVPYGKERRSVLFGRSLAIRDACDELINASRLKGGLPALFVIGPSGSGKSSLVRGGIAPELTDPGVVADVDCWRSITVEGDAGFLGALATQVYRDDGLPELAESPRKVPASWAHLSAEAPAAAAEDVVWVLDRIASAEQLRTGADRTLQARLLLVVDQLERMFGTDDAAKGSALLRALVATGRVWLIATLPSDRYAALQTDRYLLELRRHGTVYDLPPPGQAEISDIVKGPIRAAGLAFQDGERDGKSLVRILVENTPSADALPLLQMTLRKLFDGRDGMTLTWRAYEAMGGVSGAIATHADTVLADLLPAIRSELPDLVSKLTRDVKREASGRIRFTATAADINWAATPARKALVSRMVKARLLVEDEPEPGHKILRVAHEALLRQWQPANSALKAIADRALRRARLVQFGFFASAVAFLLVVAGAGWFYWKTKVAEGATRAAEKRISGVASNGSLSLARYSHEASKDAQALAALALALRLNPKNYGAAALTGMMLTQTAWPIPVASLMRHNSTIHSAQFSPDGQRVLTASADSTARLWDASTGKSIGEPMQHGGSVNSAQFSPDGQRVLTASDDKTARLWDALTGKPIGEPMQHGDGVNSAQFSPDGQRVLTASGETARLWDALTGKPIGEPMQHERTVSLAQFSPNGQQVATASGETVRLWDALTGKPIGEPMQHGDGVNSAQFSPDGQRVLTASDDKTARLWDALTGKPIGEPMKHGVSVNSAQFSPDGQRVLTAADSTARLWDALTGKRIGKAMLHGDWLNSAQFSPDGQRVLTASGGAAQLWDALTGEPIGEPMQHGDWLNSARFSPDSQWVVTTSKDNTTRLWDALTGKPIGEPMQHGDSVDSAQFSPDGQWVVTTSADYTARVWLAPLGKAISEPMQHGDSVISGQFSPDGQRVLTTSEDKTTRLWDAPTGRPIGEPMQHGDSVISAQFSPDGQRVLTASADSTARLWDALTGKPIGKPMQHGDKVYSAQFSADGQRVVTASRDKTAHLWNGVTGKPIGGPMQHDGPVFSAQFSPDGQRVVTASGETARLWDARTGKPIGEPMQHKREVFSAQFSPNCQRVLTTPSDEAWLWDALTGKPIGEPMQHGDSVSSAQFSPDGQRVVTASGETARLWDALTAKAIGEPMRHRGTVTSAQFSPDGQRVLTVGGANLQTAQLWDALTGKAIGEPMQHGNSIFSAQFSPDGQRVLIVA